MSKPDRFSWFGVARVFGALVLGLALGGALRFFQHYWADHQIQVKSDTSNQYFQPEAKEAFAASMPVAMTNFLEGFSKQVTPGEGAWFDHELMETAIAQHPVEFFKFLFHDAPKELSQRLLPQATALLALHDAPTVLRALAEVRTRSERKLAWRGVLSVMTAREPVGALAVALKCPPGLGASGAFAKELVLNFPGATVVEMLDKGMPRDWLWEGLGGAKVERFNEVFDALKSKLGEQWGTNELRGLMSRVPGDHATAQRVLAFLSTNEKFNSMKPRERGDLASKLGGENPLMAALWLESIPDEFQRSVLREQVLTAANKNNLDPKPDAATVEFVTSAASNSEVNHYIQRLAGERSHFAIMDGGTSALEWAMGMPDDASRTTALKSLFSNFKENYPFAAVAYLAKSPDAAQNETFVKSFVEDIQARFQGKVTGSAARKLQDAAGSMFPKVKALLESKGIEIKPN